MYVLKKEDNKSEYTGDGHSKNLDLVQSSLVQSSLVQSILSTVCVCD